MVLKIESNRVVHKMSVVARVVVRLRAVLCCHEIFALQALLLGSIVSILDSDLVHLVDPIDSFQPKRETGTCFALKTRRSRL